MAKATEDPPSPVEAYEAPPAPTEVGAPAPPSPAQPSYGVSAPAARETNILAVIALVASCVGLALGGVVMGHIALSQIKRTGDAGHGLALAAVIGGYALIGITIILTVVYIVFIFFVVGAATSAVGNFGDYG